MVPDQAIYISTFLHSTLYINQPPAAQLCKDEDEYYPRSSRKCQAVHLPPSNGCIERRGPAEFLLISPRLGWAWLGGYSGYSYTTVHYGPGWWFFRSLLC